jgi:N6-L-threonylcarbamoyladenine synthase
MKILSIDTACDETSAAVTEKETVLSNIVWSQASLHAKWGGILPSLAQREHKERIDWVINKAINNSQFTINNLDAIAVTAGPCLAIAGEVGIAKAKEIAVRFHKPLITINHVEGHILSPLAIPKSLKFHTAKPSFPAYGLVISGGNTQLIYIKKIGDYNILAETHDDALGESLDKAARMLGLGYPGGAILEKFAHLAARHARKAYLRRQGNPNSYSLPIPMLGKESLGFFSYSGVKTAMWKLIEKIKKEKGGLNASDIENLAASFQNIAFEHLTRVISKTIRNKEINIKHLLVGGGVSANVEVRRRLRKMAESFNMQVWFPYSKKLCGDNAAMIGVAAYFKANRDEFVKDISKVEREPRASVDHKFSWENHI